MADKKFYLTLSEEAAEILNKIKLRNRSEFICQAIVAYYRNALQGSSNEQKEIVRGLREIAEALRSLSDKLEVTEIRKENRQAAPSKSNKLDDFVTRNIEF